MPNFHEFPVSICAIVEFPKGKFDGHWKWKVDGILSVPLYLLKLGDSVNICEFYCQKWQKGETGSYLKRQNGYFWYHWKIMAPTQRLDLMLHQNVTSKCYIKYRFKLGCRNKNKKIILMKRL